MKYFIFMSIFYVGLAYGQTLLLSIGETLKLPSPAFEKISISKPNIIDIQEHESSIVLKALKKGHVTLKKSSVSYTVHVLSQEDKEGFLEFIKTVQENPWLHLSEYPFQITGDMYRFQVWKKLHHLSQAHNISYILKTRIPKDVQMKAQNFFQKQIKEKSYKIEWNQTPLVAHVSHKNHINFFQSFGIKSQEELINLPPFVEIHLLITQVSQNWSSNTLLQLELDQLSIDDIAQLFFSKNTGESHILANTKLLIESKQSMELLLGGETPIHQVNVETGSKSIKWKPYGIKLNIQPTVDSNDRIKIKLSSEFSEIDHAHSSEGSPATKNFRIQSTFHAENNKALLLSTTNRSHKGSFNQGPLFNLKNLLSLGRGFSKEKSKAFIFLTPRIIPRNL